ncbi:hypothetical protein NUU61_001762 [Penicillium alfredii]|uniref:Uncharacterized protein n=1 Tax=Penicillium alfredii TaxID=1506179 RepID=A0A9W9KFD1_9EURO|nr:uncharacterized protein NUU61_001762 [Penicillium alfredii]KAJ5104415.1 hypothetical protein NUU61_001762 [Penicillium alfredii]
MYETTTSLDLHRLSRQSLQKRYESDEEDVSESDAGGQDFVPSPVGSHRAGTFDSDLSADDSSHLDPESDHEEQLLAPFATSKRPRPVSVDTVKQTSDASFVEDAYVFHPEEPVVLELPSPDSPPMAPNLFLQPAIYVSPNTPPATHTQSRSPSPSSIFSVEEADIQVAKQVTLMEPQTRPTLVFINSLGSRSKGSKSRPSAPRSRESSYSRDQRARGRRDGEDAAHHEPGPQFKSRRISQDDTGSEPQPASTTASPKTQDDNTQTVPSATISRVSEVPLMPCFPQPPSTGAPPGNRSRLRPSGTDKPLPPPAAGWARRAEAGRRPPTTRSNSSTSVPPYSPRPVSPFLGDETRLGYMPDQHSDASSLLSRTRSPVPSATSPPPSLAFSKRGPATASGNGSSSGAPSISSSSTSSGYSVSNMLAHRSPLMMRRMTRKHSAASSIHSMSSLRSECDANGSVASAPVSAVHHQPAVQPLMLDPHHATLNNSSSSSQRRHARHNSTTPTGRGFMGLRLGKKSPARI